MNKGRLARELPRTLQFPPVMYLCLGGNFSEWAAPVFLPHGKSLWKSEITDSLVELMSYCKAELLPCNTPVMPKLLRECRQWAEFVAQGPGLLGGAPTSDFATRRKVKSL